MTNALLDTDDLPCFDAIQADDIEPALTAVLADNRRAITDLLAATTEPTWATLIQPLEALDDRLAKLWSPVSHLNSVKNNPAWRQAYNACIPKLTEYGTELGQNIDLYNAYHAIASRADFTTLTPPQQKVIRNALRDFKLSGVDLVPEQKQRYAELKTTLSELTTKFEENLLDATNAWEKYIDSEAELAGLPVLAVEQAAEKARANQHQGWCLTLDFPTYHAVMTYADRSELRQELYHAFVTRASDQGPHAGQWDNSDIMRDIVNTRQQLAELLGFQHYADYSLATKMAANVDEVMTFLNQIVNQAKPQAEREFAELAEFAKLEYGIDSLQAWDVSYYSEKLRQHCYAISQETLRPYFPEDKVLQGLFAIVEALYGITIKERNNVTVWHTDVRFFEIYAADGSLQGQFYTDLYARPHKRGGAWMDECRSRYRTSTGTIQIPVAYLTCNFTPKSDDKPCLMTHDEVETLFHEFGHTLHHLLTQIEVLDISGINGVPWDAVELPSQFMENWCWSRTTIPMISAHFETGEPLPDALLDKLFQAKHFQSAMQVVRQLEFALFDMQLFSQQHANDNGDYIQRTLDSVRIDVAVVPVAAFNRFQHSFSHIFAGGYAAGYYSYLWAEVLSADAFGLFEEQGVLDRKAGLNFLTCILQQGGAEEPMDLFIQFRGRKPTIDAFLRQRGIR